MYLHTYKIAIDGPAGAGKSTIAQKLAQKLKIEYIDTGAMYRAITLKAMHLGVDMEQEDAYEFLKSTKIDIVKGKIILDNVDVSEAIRSIEVTKNVSTPSKIACVRTFLVELQRKISDNKSVVMDGRDIGTVVLPNADLKIYLDATVDCRADRRMKERSLKGINASFDETKEEIIVRDRKDSTRDISPLKKADDAVVIDSSNLTVDQVVNKIIYIVNERGLISMKNENFKEGQEVKGTIKNVTKEAVYVILENDVTGVIYVNDMDSYTEGQKLNTIYHEGEDFTALVKQVAKDRKTSNPLVILSTKLYAAKDKLPAFVELREKDEIIEAKIIGASNGGADLEYNDFKIFMPIKNSDLSPEALKKMKGEKIKVIVTNVYPENLKVIVSQSIAEKKIRRAEKQAALDALNVGDVVEGKVEKILDFGAIIDLGGVTGLLHRNEMDHKMVRNVNDYVKVDDVVKVQIINLEKDRIGLSMKTLAPHPWTVLKEQYHVGDVFDGVVTKVIPAGLIIKLTDNYSGLMPNSEYSWFINQRIDGKVVEGDTIKVKVISIEDERNRVSLSHRATLENTWADLKLRRGDTIKVTIKSSEERGAKVAYGNVEGYLPLSEVVNGRRISKIEEVYPLETEVEVMVQDFDAGRAKLVVSIKALETAKERATFDNYLKQEADDTPTSTLGDLFGEAFKEFFDEGTPKKTKATKKK